MMPGFKCGDKVIYVMSKRSRHPGPRAQDIHPSSKGDDYGYRVDKFWIVEEVIDDETIRTRTRRGKVHTLRVDDPNLHKANLFQRWWYRDRFPTLENT